MPFLPLLSSSLLQSRKGKEKKRKKDKEEQTPTCQLVYILLPT
jgi:hypothetical protein